MTDETSERAAKVRPAGRPRARDLAQDRRGVAAIELALCMPFLLVLLMGIFDFGNLAVTYMQVAAAANAGAQWVYQNGSCNTTSISSAVTSATKGSVTATPSPTCGATYCVTSNVLVSQSSGSCSSGDTLGTYAIIHAQATVTTLAPWSTLVLPSTLSSVAAIRYE